VIGFRGERVIGISENPQSVLGFEPSLLNGQVRHPHRS
jgi:hypothetical protein